MSNSFYIFLESLKKNYEAGGVVMFPILLSGAIGFYFLFSGWFRIGSDYFRQDIYKVVKNLKKNLGVNSRNILADSSKKTENEIVEISIKYLKKRGGILARELCYALEIAKINPKEFENYMQVRFIKTVRYMEQGNHIVQVMAAAAPLLGLLGTVTGMVSTFEVITLYGNQNPVLMADGISEALISTQSGLLVAFPLTLLKQRLDERIEILKGEMQLGATIIENYFIKNEGEDEF